MIIVNILKRTGVFGYVAIRSAKWVKSEPWKIIVIFSLFTAVSSAFLDNVTTILLIVPVTLVIVDTLEMNPFVFIMPLVIISNIGGTATLIGDPPNIMIGSATGLGFIDFIMNLAPIVIIITISTIIYFKFLYKGDMQVKEENKKRILTMDENLAIKDNKLLVKSLAILGLTIVGFIMHQILHMESATVALIGASVLLLISGIEPEEILIEIEWPTIFFFTALFVLVGGIEKVGVLEFLAEKLILFTNGNLVLLVLLILWGSAILSSFLDNIPFVATMIPLIKNIGIMTTVSIRPLWWALALGACLGGNGTIVGASSNVIVSGMMEKHGNKISFIDFMKVGFPIMILSIILSSIYLLIFYI